MREHFLGLVESMLDSVDPDPKRFIDAVLRSAEAVRSGKNPLSEGGLMALVASDEQREVLNQVSGLMSLLEGHGDVTVDRAGEGLIPSAERFGRVLRQRRNSAHGLAKLIQQLIGLDAKLAQYEQGERFIEAVEDEGGTALLDLAWERPEHLPTIAEIRDPAGWIERVAPARVG
jgi:putative hydrolase